MTSLVCVLIARAVDFVAAKVEQLTRFLGVFDINTNLGVEKVEAISTLQERLSADSWFLRHIIALAE